MTRAGFAITLFVLALALIPGAACSRGEAATISPDGLRERQSSSSPPLILDVRSLEEFEQGHIPGAVHIPYDELPGRIDEIAAAKSDAIIVYCLAGPRARRGEQTLQENGFANVLHLDGGFRAWAQAGLPIERAPGS